MNAESNGLCEPGNGKRPGIDTDDGESKRAKGRGERGSTAEPVGADTQRDIGHYAMDERHPIFRVDTHPAGDRFEANDSSITSCADGAYAGGAEGNLARVGSKTGLLSYAHGQDLEGSWSLHRVSLVESDWQRRLSDTGVLSPVDQSTRNREYPSCATRDGGDSRPQNVGGQDDERGLTHVSPPSQSVRLRLRGNDASLEDGLRARDPQAGDPHAYRGAAACGEARQTVHQLPVHPSGRDGGDPPAEGWRPNRDRTVTRSRGGDSRSTLVGPVRDGRAGAAPLSGILEAAKQGGPGGEDGSHACQLEPPGGDSDSSYCRGTGGDEASASAAGQVGGGDDSGGETKGEASLSSTVVGVSPYLGAVESTRTRGARGALADMGALETPPPHRGAHCVASRLLGDKQQQQSGSTSSSSAGSVTSEQRERRRGSRCQAVGCSAKLSAEKEKVADLQKRLYSVEAELRSKRATGGEMQARADCAEAMRRLKVLELESGRLRSDRNTYVKLAGQLAMENSKQAKSIAEYSAQIAQLNASMRANASAESARARKSTLAARKAATQAAADIERVRKEAVDSAAKAMQTIATSTALMTKARREATEVEERAAEKLREAEAWEQECKGKVEEMQQKVDDSLEAAAVARDEAREHAAAMREADLAKVAAERMMLLQKRREEYAKRQVLLAQQRSALLPTHDRTPEEWAALTNAARRKAAQREREYITGFFTSHEWRIEDIAAALDKLGMTRRLFESKPFFSIYFEKTGKLVEWMERSCFGFEFALYLHFDLKLTLPKILQLTQAASKRYYQSIDSFKSRPLLYDPYHVAGHNSISDSEREYKTINVPRIAPPASRLIPVIRQLESELNVRIGEDGRMALRSVTELMQELLAQDPGFHGMPPLPDFLGGDLKLPIILSWDGTGYGSQQFNTFAVRNPYFPHSAQQLRILALGNCGDDRAGTTRLLGDNLPRINEYISNDSCKEFIVEGKTVNVKLDVYVSTDLSAWRHCEHMANSGFCGCTRDFALRQTPTPPKDIVEMKLLLTQCKEPSVAERDVLSHNPLPGETLPRPCTAPGCAFAHTRATAATELRHLYATEAELVADASKKGKARFAAWRKTHFLTHFNVNPGLYGAPFFRHHYRKQILEPLHCAELGLPKIPWKHGVLNNASDDAREAISEQLKAWRHTLDCRRKDDNRCRASKWFTGEKWSSFCAGEGGSPGGPIAIATLVLIIADDMQQRGVNVGSGHAAADTETTVVLLQPPKASKMPTGRNSFAARNAARNGNATGASPSSVEQEDTDSAGLRHIPSAMQKNADQEDINMIKTLFGSRAQTIINTLLAFDGYFNWYFPFKASVPLFCDVPLREQRAFDNCCRAIEMHEAFERLSIRGHKSFLPHGAIFKSTRDILEVGDVWAFSTTALELQNADTKRTAQSSGSRRLQVSTSGLTQKALTKSAGPSALVPSKGYSTTMCLSTLKHLLVSQVLKRGSGLYATPSTRRKERLFGMNGAGRTSLPHSGVKLEARMKAEANYDPRLDTCLKAFVRLLAARASDIVDE